MQNEYSAESAVKVTAVQKQDGEITAYQLSDGKIVDKTTAVAMAKAGQISGVTVAERKGSEYLRSLPDGDDANNLDSLPPING